MSCRVLFLLVVIGLFGIIFKINASAQELPASAAQEEWNPPSAGPITTWTAPLCGKGKFVIQPFFFYNRTRGEFDADGKFHGGDKEFQYQEQLFAQYGITDRLELDGQVVYQENYLKQDGVSAHAQGFGDSYLFLRYCALEEKGWLPAITGLIQLKMPTGKSKNLDSDKMETDSMGTGSWDPGFGINLTKKLKPFIFHADASYSFPQGGTTIDEVKTRYANYLNYDFGVEYFLPKGFNLMLEVNNFLQGDQWQDGSRVPASDTQYLTVCPGIGWSNNKVQFLLAYQRTLWGINTDANDSVVLTGVYTF
jgi:hypothetical protein